MNKINNVPVTGLNFPVVPKDDEEIHLQFSADHTEFDIDAFIQQEKGCA